MLSLVVSLALQALPDEGQLHAALARGDRHYTLRAEAASGARAEPARIDAALGEYRGAVALDPDSLEARSRLLRALYFRATFCGAGEEERRRTFEEARRIAIDGLERLEARLGRPKKKDRLGALRGVRGAAELHFWAAVAWGEWAQLRSRLTATRQGAGGRIRDLAQTVIDLDPDLEDGGGFRILGRLHDVSPRLPFLTGWVSRQAAIENLREALRRGPHNCVNRLFLAEALLRHEPSARAEAVALLRDLAASEPSAAYRVEDTHFVAQARRRLAELR
jgi:hypothetical protein